jgi:hypothetical protein
MRHPLPLLVLCLWLPGCVLFQRPPRPVHAPPQEAASFVWPEVFPEKDHQLINGATLGAIQLAMEDFLPWDIKPHRGATPTEVCLYKRDSYDVLAAPGGEGVVFVEIMLRPGACHAAGEIVLDGGGRYAIDVKQWRILASQR